MDMRIPPLKSKMTLESNPLKSRNLVLVRSLAVIPLDGVCRYAARTARGLVFAPRARALFGSCWALGGMAGLARSPARVRWAVGRLSGGVAGWWLTFLSIQTHLPGLPATEHVGHVPSLGI